MMAPDFDLTSCQPFDLVFGQDLRETRTQTMVLSALRRLRPWGLIVGYPCTYYSIFNENMNFSQRREELQAIRNADQPLRKFVSRLCREQWENGRLFIVEKPAGSRLWSHEVFRVLADLPGANMTKCHLGAYGAETLSSEPIRKPVQLLSNLPGLNDTLANKLSATDLLYCKPLQGKEVTRSQIYPDAFVRQLLLQVRGWIQQQQPLRFGTFEVLAAARPTLEPAAWDEVFEQVGKSFASGARFKWYIHQRNVASTSISPTLSGEQRYSIPMALAPSSWRTWKISNDQNNVSTSPFNWPCSSSGPLDKFMIQNLPTKIEVPTYQFPASARTGPSLASPTRRHLISANRSLGFTPTLDIQVPKN